MKATEILNQAPSSENEIYWKQHTQRCVESGLSKSAYCKQQDVNYPRFIYWSKKLAKSALPDLVEVKIKPEIKSVNPINEVRCKLQLKNNIYLYIENQQALLAVLTHLS